MENSDDVKVDTVADILCKKQQGEQGPMVSETHVDDGMDLSGSMGLPLLREEKPLASWRLASPGEKMPLNARESVSRSGSRLSVRSFGMSANPETPAWVCTPGVPSPVEPGDAGQTQTGDVTHSMGMEWSPSIITLNVDTTKYFEQNRRENFEQKHAHDFEKRYEQINEHEFWQHNAQETSETGTITDDYRTPSPNKSYIRNVVMTKVKASLPKPMKRCDNLMKTLTGTEYVHHIDIDVDNDEEHVNHVVQGTFHQGNPILFGRNAGNQCVANSLSAALYQTIVPIHMWTSSHMDTVLMTGDELYTHLQSSSTIHNNYLLVHELPAQLEVFNTFYDIKICESLASIVTNDINSADLIAFNAVPLDQAIQMSLLEHDVAFACFCENTILIGKTKGNGFFIFDPHSRSSKGMMTCEGKSTLILTETISEVYNHLMKLAMSMNLSRATPCEITSLEVRPTQNVLIHDINFGSSEAEIFPNLHEIKNVFGDDSSNQMLLYGQEFKTDHQHDDVIVVSATNQQCDFSPLSTTLKKVLCKKYDLIFHSIHAGVDLVKIKDIGFPSCTYKIVGDGNCFFRALSYSLSNTESNHLKMRNLICEHAWQNSETFKSIMRNENENVECYLEKMYKNQTWATEFEIIVASHMLQTNIYTFSEGKWLCYSPSLVDPNFISHQGAVYLDHSRGNHYDVVLNTRTNTSHMEVLKKSSAQKGLDKLKKMKMETKIRKERKNIKRALEKENAGKIKEKHPKHAESYVDSNSLCKNTDTYTQNRSIPEMKKLFLESEEVGFISAPQAKEKLTRKSQQSVREKERYAASSLLQDKKKKKSRSTYMISKQTKLDMMNHKYANDPHYQTKAKAASKERYASNTDYQKEISMSCKQQYKTDLTFQSSAKTRSKEKYKSDLTFQSSAKTKSKEKYKSVLIFQSSAKARSKEKYKSDLTFQRSVKTRSKEKYKTDLAFKKGVKTRSITKYKNDMEFKAAVKAASKMKYKTNENFQETLKKTIKEKYKTDEDFQDKVKTKAKRFIKDRYRNDNDFHEKVKRNSREMGIYKYKSNHAFREGMVMKGRAQYKSHIQRKKNQGLNTFEITSKFRTEAAKGPVYVCSCCFRLLFANQVQQCSLEAYEQKGEKIKSMADYCISRQNTKNMNGNERNEFLWICKACHRKLLTGTIPAECFRNGLSLEDVPECLAVLNKLEQHLVALHIPFMKIVALPKGGQNAISGPVVCVPTNMDKALSLPRQMDSDLIIRVKLKRKLCYKGHYDYQFVNTEHIHSAINFLINENIWYSNVKNNNNDNSSATEDGIMNADKRETENRYSGNVKNTKKEMSVERKSSVQIERSHVSSNEVDSNKMDQTIKKEDIVNIPDDEREGVQYDTCLQPCDIGQEVLDHYFDDVFHLAPAEGNNPIMILQSKGNEGKSFPTQFPHGHNTFDEARSIPISLSRYYNNRLMHVDSRFARDTNYIFYCQYISELKQVIEKTQISLRKSKTKGKDGKKITTETLQNTSELKKLLQNDEALRFMQPIRGTPSYWQNTQKDLFAMLRQIGIPTWFCSFSAAEFRWPDIINVILKQQGDERLFDDLDWLEKSNILKTNPVTVARMFDHRFHLFLQSVILSASQPIGKVKDYFYRVEFQQRGSPHIHCLFWVENAPKFEDGVEHVCEFIDKYVTCRLPNENEDIELREIVENVQQHSKKHSKSCKKGNKTCRFNFPRPPSEKTFIVNPDEENCMQNCNAENKNEIDHEKQVNELKKKNAKELLQEIWDELQNGNEMSTTQLFDKLGIDQEQYEEANRVLSTKKCITLEREPNEAWINQYNPILLRCWNANMDIQYVLDAYSCIVYIVSYISKAEREMGLLLKQTQMEAEEGNLSAKETMKAVGSTYLNHREVGVQEAVYRVCGLHMKECTRKIVFIPVGENPTRLSKPLSQLKECSSSEDSDSNEAWMLNIVDRYLARPTTADFQLMCLATFSSLFRVLCKSQVKNNENVFELQNNKGFIQRRTRSDNAIIRFYRANAEKSPEVFYRCILQLFLPYWVESQLKPPAFDLYQTFYETGHVRFEGDCSLHRVKEVVDGNRSKFVMNEAEITAAEERFDAFGELEDAWGNLCPESEVQRQECLDERNSSNSDDLGIEQTADLNTDSKDGIPFYVVEQSHQTRSEIFEVLRSLNDKQRDVFYFVRNWCIEKKLKRTPKQFHLFVTGGAGTGKSHLIKSIKYEASRILSKDVTEPDKQTVLLTAFTGTAAFNISGCTVHHAFKLQKRLPIPYEPLGEQSLSTLRYYLDSIQILVIDEVSMIFKRLLYYIHERLVQIKQCKQPFGGVSILAVGDFYQLPPVRQGKTERLYNTSGLYPVDYWQEMFSLVHLDEIMRQREDRDFAVMLNTLRTRTGEQSIPQDIMRMLKSCQREASDDILHVFATNAEVNAHNLMMIKKYASEILDVQARDFKKDRTSGKLTEMNNIRSQTQREDNDRLPSCLLLAIGARVMLTRNVDVSDGLANGVTGTVVEFVKGEVNKECGKQSYLKSVGVHFDNERVGQHKATKANEKRIVYIDRVEDEATKTGVVRHQFPLKLAWACTAHKVQGQTCKEIAVKLDKMFAAGQAYVALSRATSKSGLHIEFECDDVLNSKIYADKEVEDGLKRMKLFQGIHEYERPPEIKLNTDITLILLNIQNLSVNLQQLKSDRRFRNVDAICLTETWINHNTDTRYLQLDQFSFSHRMREESYNNQNKRSQDMKRSNGGGVGIYINHVSQMMVESVSVENIEAMLIYINDRNLVIITAYRPPSWPAEQFVKSLQLVINKLIMKRKTVIVMGDFNEDISTCPSTPGYIARTMKEMGFSQKVQTRTTDQGTTIDHVYVSQSVEATCIVLPVFYSYHEAVYVRLAQA